jgi:two-component system, sensor histidine kinase and response regulator
MHKILVRQLGRTIGLTHESELPELLDAARQAGIVPGIDARVAGLLQNLGPLLERIDAAYAQSDRDLELRARSLDLSSEELNATNAQLRADLAARNRAVQSLRDAVKDLLGTAHDPAVEASEDLESLSRIIANLVREREEQRSKLDNLKFALDEHAIVSMTDLAGNITYANTRFCQVSGYRRDELIGRNHRILKSGRHDAEFFKRMWATISAGQVWHGEICNRAKDGHEYWVAATIVPSLDPGGRPYEYIAIRTDISARKRVEMDLIEARNAADAANRAKSEFLANMSHEIRTPMNGIIGMTELALDTRLDGEQQEYLGIVRTSANALLTLINDILDFSKIEAGKLTVEQIPYDLRVTVAETLKSMTLRAHQKGIEIIFDIATNVPARVIGDPGRLRQVLVNLVGNAVKFTERGEIVVTVGVAASGAGDVTVQIDVRDSGIGIQADKLALIFEAFTQEDSSTTRKYGGTGLGLAISNRLVELMGGSMWVESTPGAGSTFHFTTVLGIDQAAPRPEAPPAELKERMVLLVDDNALNSEIIAKQLGHVGMRHARVASGAAAQVWLQDQPCPDVILLDAQMPDMDGFALAGWIRQQAALARVPMIMLTSGAMRGDALRCRAMGIDAYFPKPVSESELRQALATILGGAKAEQAVVMDSAPPLLTRHELRQQAATLDVLLVEDNPINQKVAMHLLAKWGHRVTLANNGQEALDRLQDVSFDVVLMDMQMPVMGGVEATQVIRQREQTQDLPRLRIVAMTANAQEADREACLAAGMDDYLSKPFKAAELAEKLLAAPARQD